MGTVYAYIYSQLSSNKDRKDIWVPPKPTPALPFGLGPPATAPKPADFKKTTYAEHEQEVLREAATQLAMNVGMSFFMAFQFQIYFSLLVQSIMMPLNLWDFILFKKYVLGQKKNANGTPLYGEHFREPTERSIAAAERVVQALASGNAEELAAARADAETADAGSRTVPSVAQSSVDPNEPRVVDLSDEDEKATKDQKAKKTATKEASSSSSSSSKDAKTSSSTNIQDLD